MTSAMHDAELAALRALYADADALYAGWSCPASTECCRFGVTGREPYVTSIELEALSVAIAARGGPRSWKRAVPLAAEPMRQERARLPIARDERRCPLLDAAGRCAVYAARPLGCRTFYCDRADAATKVKQREVNDLVRRMRDLAARHAPGGDLGRPLTRALASRT
jgi:Fe-S-cluster containining protein